MLVLKHRGRWCVKIRWTSVSSGGFRGARGARAHPPPGAQILSISCSFREILTKSYVGGPLGSWRPIPPGKSWIRRWYHMSKVLCHRLNCMTRYLHCPLAQFPPPFVVCGKRMLSVVSVCYSVCSKKGVFMWKVTWDTPYSHNFL